MNENTTVYFNRQFVPLSEAKVSVMTHALNYGTGVFEGIRGYWDAEQSELFLLRPLEHYQALEVQLRHRADRSGRYRRTAHGHHRRALPPQSL